MVEVIAQSKKVKVSSDEEEQGGYAYDEPPRSTIQTERIEVSGEYPRISTPYYEHIDPPRDTIQPLNPVVEVEESERVSAIVPIITEKIEVPVFPTEQKIQLIIDDNTALSFKEEMKLKKIPGDLTVHTFILLLLGSQNLFLIAVLFSNNFLFYAFEVNWINEFLLFHWWISLVAAGMYAALYVVLLLFSQRIRISASCFFLILVALGCESVLIIYASNYLDFEYMFLGSIQMITCVYSAAILAQAMGNRYTALIGRLVAMAACIGIMALYLAFSRMPFESINVVKHI